MKVTEREINAKKHRRVVSLPLRGRGTADAASAVDEVFQKKAKLILLLKELIIVAGNHTVI